MVTTSSIDRVDNDPSVNTTDVDSCWTEKSKYALDKRLASCHNLARDETTSGRVSNPLFSGKAPFKVTGNHMASILVN